MDWDWVTFAVCVAIAALVLLPPSLDPAIRFKQWMENKERRRRTTERLREEDPYDEL